jgi:hypothetical protein
MVKKEGRTCRVKLKGRKTAQDPTSASECVGFALCGGKSWDQRGHGACQATMNLCIHACMHVSSTPYLARSAFLGFWGPLCSPLT